MCEDTKDAAAAGAGTTGMAGSSTACDNGKILPAPGAAAPVDDGKLPIRVKLLLGMGEAVQGMYITIGGYYLNSFLLETACIDPALVGAIQAIQGTFDALNDPFMGVLSDRTRTRWGRRRPWLLFGAPFLACFYFGLWCALPKGTPQYGRFLFGLVMYMGVCVGITAIQVQIGSLVPELTDNYDERTHVSGWRILIMAIMGLLTALGHGQIIKQFPNDPAMGYKVSAVCVAGLMWIFAWTVFAGIKEKFQEIQESKEKIPLMKSVCSIWRDKSFLCVTGVYLCGPSAVVTIQSNFYMFSKYILMDEDVLPMLMLCAQGLGMVCLPFWVLLSMRFDKRFVYMVGGTGFMVAMCAIFFVQTSQQAIAVACFCGVNIGVVYLIPYSMMPDVVDEDELRTGKRREGIYTGFFTTALKLSATLALTFTNLMLKGFGYSPPETTCGADLVEDKGDDGMGATQSAEVLLCIRMLCSFVPGTYMFFAVLCAWMFPITRQRQKENTRKAMEMRAERQARALGVFVDGEVAVEGKSDQPLKLGDIQPGDDQMFVSGFAGGLFVEGNDGKVPETLCGANEPSSLRSTAGETFPEPSRAVKRAMVEVSV